MKEGWKRSTLNEVCFLNKNQGKYSNLNYVGMENIEANTGKILSYEDSSEIKSSTFRYDKGDVLYGRLRPYLKKVIIAPFDGCCSTEIYPIKTTHISNKFLMYWFLLDSITGKINETCSGCRMPRANMKLLMEFEINYPSISEQQRIVDILDKAFEKIDKIKSNAEKNLQQAKDLFNAKLSKELLDKEHYGKQKLGEIYDVRDGTHDSPKYQEIGYPLVTSKNLRSWGIDVTDVKYISEEDYLKINQRSKVDKGDVLFAMIGSIGNPAIVKEEPNYAIKNVALFKVPSNQSGMYLMYCLASNYYLSTILKNKSGANQPFVSLNYLRNFEIVIPPLDEQQKIVSKLDSLSEKCKNLEANYNRILTECDALKQAFLRKAFNGEL